MGVPRGGVDCGGASTDTVDRIAFLWGGGRDCLRYFRFFHEEGRAWCSEHPRLEIESDRWGS